MKKKMPTHDICFWKSSEFWNEECVRTVDLISFSNLSSYLSLLSLNSGFSSVSSCLLVTLMSFFHDNMAEVISIIFTAHGCSGAVVESPFVQRGQSTKALPPKTQSLQDGRGHQACSQGEDGTHSHPNCSKWVYTAPVVDFKLLRCHKIH